MNSLVSALVGRDQFALAYRISGAIFGLALGAWSLASSSWKPASTLVLLFVVVVGGGALYHLLTSLARCPRCASRMVNLRIGSSGWPQRTAVS
jgi:hypothetical protein